ncbi:transcriptional regulator [Levilactobacillus namurensis DSM 19117]|uniref:Transcriptional regulator n=2 Tax=Levilactobacillus namurensis TaxID=380393 RepID=A0A0R1KAU6_9LACO|nr:MarR family transcriptional regulator [Levilactobacillus namurensis]KRK77377.1 transcriptional regulator [Levilactobacillus namurensis DSM 19117]MDT7013133.1 MarR family transcriptional regulator [Levilactobacillus namurensis]GEO74348.1 MarR family transcriptional regulator [Levilactobacillus namurensis]
MDSDIFEALFDIVTFFDQPQRDRCLLQRARVHLEPAALPIVVWVARQPNISVGQLADHIGRNHSSVSRQVDRLMAAGWLEEPDRRDQRVRRLTLSTAGHQGLLRIQLARAAELQERLSDYSTADRAELLRVLQRLAQTLQVK